MNTVSLLTRGAAALALIASFPALASGQATNPQSGQNTTPVAVTPDPMSIPNPPAAPPSASSPHWTGFYVGGVFGEARSKTDATTTTVFSPTGYFATTSPPAIDAAGAQTLTSNKWLYGIEGGFDVQAGHIVFGGEIDYSSMKLSASESTTGVYPCCAPTDFTVTQSIDTTWLTTIRGRLGVAAGPALLYGTVGVAMTDLNYQAVFTDTFASATENGGVDATQHTWVYGGGAEFRVSMHLSVKGEYLYAKFDTVSTTSTNFMAFTPPIPFTTNPFTHTAALTLNVIRGGVNIRF